MEEFLSHFKNHGRAEHLWLRGLFEGVRQQLYPLASLSLCLSELQLCLAVLSKIQKALGSDSTLLPVSYRLVSVSELIREQRSACCSSLSWTSSQYRDQARRAEQALPDYRAIPRDNLLLIGYLRDGRQAGSHEGVWRVSDAGGSVQCEMLQPSPLWMGRLMLFPAWNYIPQDATADEVAEGCLELMTSPVCVIPEGMTFDPGASLSEVMSVKSAAELLRQRCESPVCVCVAGQLRVVCPQLVFSGKSFFCLILSEGQASVPVIIMEAKHQYWRRCVEVGQSVCVTALSVCRLRAAGGRFVLCARPQSRLHPHPGPQEDPEEPEDTTNSDSQTHTDPESSSAPVRKKCSTVISYKGTITKVLNWDAGLFEMDSKVWLCLAYQQPQTWSRALRPGAEIQLHGVHFLYRPSLFAQDVVLCACLRSSVQITAFSALSSKVKAMTSPSSLQRVLLEKNLGISQYLWLCYCHKTITERLCPRWVRAERVCAVARRLLDSVCETKPDTEKKRDIYREMLQEPHSCPLNMYSVSRPSVELWSVRELSDWMSTEVWASLSLKALLPASVAHMTAAELNAELSWSVHAVSLAETTSQPVLLVGVLEVNQSHSTLQFRDLTHTLDCVCVDSSQSGSRSVDVNSAWLGCLVCVPRCTLVMERFMKTQFPSWKHLDQPSYITHKHCRVYVQLCVTDLVLVSPSAAMNLHMTREKDRQRRTEMEKCSDGQTTVQSSSSDPGTSRPLTSKGSCVSRLFRLESKQGLTFRNCSSSAEGPQLGFLASVTCLGDVQSWSRDPKNCRIEEREKNAGSASSKMELHFYGLSARWFPVLHPGALYRLIAFNTEDTSVLKGQTVSASHGVQQLSSSTLPVEIRWKIHTVVEQSDLQQTDGPAVMSVSEVLHLSSTPEMVSFYGVVLKRSTLPEENPAKSRIPSLVTAKDLTVESELKVRLAMEDAEAPSQIIQVYVDLSNGPYVPGLVDGATVLFWNFQRKVSRTGNVYCSSLPISCVTVTGVGSVRLGSAGSVSPAPMILLSEWMLTGAQQRPVGGVEGHIVRVLSLRLQWTCSLCTSVFRQNSCSRTYPLCDSTCAVFQAEAKTVFEDGSAEAHVWFSSETVPDLLMLDTGRWEGLQRHVKVKGHVKVYMRGNSMMSDVDPDDSLIQYLCYLCSTNHVCRPVVLSCKRRVQKSVEPQVRKMRRRHMEFVSRFATSIQLQCLKIESAPVCI